MGETIQVHYQQLYANKFDNLDKLDRFLERNQHKLPEYIREKSRSSKLPLKTLKVQLKPFYKT